MGPFDLDRQSYSHTDLEQFSIKFRNFIYPAAPNLEFHPHLASLAGEAIQFRRKTKL